MKFGCHLPVYGPAATRATILGFARRMESLGFDSLWAGDHVVIPWKIRSRYPYNPTGDFPLSPETPFLEPLTTLAVVAGATEHIALGTTVLVLAHRHPVLLAKMLATLRRVAELGDGWHPAFPTPQSLGEALPRLRDACRRAGRDMASVTISGRVGLAARRSADELLAELKALRDLGVSHVILESRARDLGEMAELYEKFARDVRP